MGARLLIYIDHPSVFEQAVGLGSRRGPESNVVLLVPRDEHIFAESVRDDGLWYAPWSQTAVDLLGGTDREPSAGVNLVVVSRAVRSGHPNQDGPKVGSGPPAAGRRPAQRAPGP